MYHDTKAFTLNDIATSSDIAVIYRFAILQKKNYILHVLRHLTQYFCILYIECT